MTELEQAQGKNATRLEFSEKLIQLKRTFKVTNRQLGLQLGVSASYIGEIIKGRAPGKQMARAVDLLIIAYKVRSSLERSQKAEQLQTEAARLLFGDSPKVDELILHEKFKPSSAQDDVSLSEAKKNALAFFASVDQSFAGDESERKPGAGEKSGRKEKQTESSSHQAKAPRKARSARGSQT